MQKWQYLYVEVDFGSSKPKLINGQELRDWKKQPHISVFMEQMGDQGWELIGFFNQGYNTTNPMIFKRPKP